jgi:hypothetical protein
VGVVVVALVVVVVVVLVATIEQLKFSGAFSLAQAAVGGRSSKMMVSVLFPIQLGTIILNHP